MNPKCHGISFAALSLLCASSTFVLLMVTFFVYLAVMSVYLASVENGIGATSGGSKGLGYVVLAAVGIMVGGLVAGILSLVRRERQWRWGLAAIALNLLAPVLALALMRLVMG